MPVHRFEDLDLTRQYTYADYLTWRFRERVELLRGWVRKMGPAPSMYHQRVSLELTRLIANFFHGHPCFVFHAPFDVRLVRTDGGESVVQPDLCVVCEESKLTKQGCTGAPDWVIEILSPGNSAREMRDKYELYEESGVREYWVVDPERSIILRYVLRDGGYVGLAPRGVGDDAIEAGCFEGFRISGAEVFP